MKLRVLFSFAWLSRGWLNVPVFLLFSLPFRLLSVSFSLFEKHKTQKTLGTGLVGRNGNGEWE